MSCDYAACPLPGTEQADGWRFCPQHLAEHNSLFHDAPWPRTAPSFPASAFWHPCGTAGAYARHRRRGEHCAVCIDAATRLKHGYTSTMANKQRWAS